MDEINEHKKAFAKLKAPFLDLLGSAQAGRFVVLNDIKKVQKLIASEKTKAATAQAKPPGKKDTSASVPQHPIFEEAGNMSEKFEPVAESDWQGLQLDMPAIIDIEQDTLGKLFGLEAKLALGQLKKMFKAGIAPRAEVALDLVIVLNIASTLEPKIPQGMMFYKWQGRCSGESLKPCTNTSL
eukprot:s11069_g2.t1